MRKVLLFHAVPLNPGGGGEGVAVWVVQALSEWGEVTVFVPSTPNWARLDQFYGTSLSARPPRLLLWPDRWARLPSKQLRLHLAMRRVRALAPAYELVVSTFNEIYAGRPAVQYLHCPWSQFSQPQGQPFRLGRVIRWLGRCLSGLTAARCRQNLTLANSDWTGRHFGLATGASYQVLHPPALGDPRSVPWQERSLAFLCISRLVESKELDKVIDIVAAVRSRGHRVKLTLAGATEREAYLTRLQARARQHADWLQLRLDLSRAELDDLIGSHRYGLHGMPEEHYGMAIAEMVRGGCLVFVPDRGGQVEIVADPRLQYGHPEQAVERICAVLESPALQQQLRADLEGERAQLGTAFFQQRFRQLVLEGDLGPGLGRGPR